VDDDAAMGEVFLGWEAIGDGLSRHELRRWYRPLFRGAYIAKWSTPTLADRAVGAVADVRQERRHRRRGRLCAARGEVG
jgi:hypothetical protein